MSEIESLYTYPNGEKLDPEEHSRNLFTEQITPSSRSIIRTINGEIDRNNIKPGQKVGAQHIQPRETHVLKQEYGFETLDFVDDAFGDAPTEDDTVRNEYQQYVPIPGCSVRIFLPRPCAAVMFNWSFQYCVARTWEMLQEEKAATPGSLSITSDITRSNMSPPKVMHLAFFNGSPEYETKRDFPQTIWGRNPATIIHESTYRTTSSSHTTTEGRNARHWDLHLMKTNLEAGWHELSARVFLQPHAFTLDTKVYLRSARMGMRQPAYATYNKSPSYLRNRLTFGIRNARAIAFSDAGVMEPKIEFFGEVTATF